jgi:GT2 family glycosyltransferase
MKFIRKLGKNEMKKVKVSIIIVNYNTQELVLDCLESIKNSINIDFGVKVIVVDNASTDSSVNELKKLRWIELIENSSNTGFAKANNLAIGKIEGDYVWFLNPDTVVEPNTIATLVGYMDKNSDVGIVTPKLTLPDGSLDKNCHRGMPTPWNSFCHFTGLSKILPKSRLFSGYYLGHIPENVETEVEVVGGSSVLTRRDIGEKIGWWDETYFMYGEDIAFAYEVKKAGYKIMYVPSVTIHHYHGASSGLKKTSKQVSKATKETKIRSIKAGTNAMKLFYRKYYRDKYSSVVTTFILFTISLLGSIRMAKITILG